jgi:glutamine amidotransferase
MKIGIIDLGINNLNSVFKSFTENIGPKDNLEVLTQSGNYKKLDLLVLPGLGKFGSGMNSLAKNGFQEIIFQQVDAGSKVLGICLGMQLLGSNSEESPEIKGLDLIKSFIQRLPKLPKEKVPHTGWASTYSNSGLFPSLTSSGDFYFVHSYHMVPKDPNNILCTSPFGSIDFVSAIQFENVLGFQFHPEKSGKKGKQLILEVLNWVKNEN